MKNDVINDIYKTDAPKVLATLLRLLGDYNLAEDAMQEAFSIALEKWPSEGVPENPYSWLVSTGRFKAIDHIRRLKNGQELASNNLENKQLYHTQPEPDTNLIEEDQLRLIYLCCHPLLPLESRTALALRDVCGMKTGEIARAFLVPFETIKKRITRAKQVFTKNNIPFEIPNRKEITARSQSVLQVIYLIFNEGYSASTGKKHIREDLTAEAIYLCRKLLDLNPSPEVQGLLALMLIQESRKYSRITSKGAIIPLEHQDRALWNEQLIKEGIELIHKSAMSGQMGYYSLQAAIASVHATAKNFENTRWDIIVQYYNMLLEIHPSPIIEMNKAIAVGMKNGPEAGLAILNELIQNKKLEGYHSIYTAKAEFLLKINSIEEAITCYRKALSLTQQEAEQSYLQNKISKILKKV